jgi:hypothetical protein
MSKVYNLLQLPITNWGWRKTPKITNENQRTQELGYYEEEEYK